MFNTGGDPVRYGLVASLNRPGGNVTGVASLGKELVAKRLELLRELVPTADAIAFLVNPERCGCRARHERCAGRGSHAGAQLIVLKVSSEDDIDTAFAPSSNNEAGGLLAAVDPFLQSRREQLVALAARYAVPAIYDRRDFAAAGGLMSYGTSLSGRASAWSATTPAGFSRARSPPICQSNSRRSSS